MNKDEYKEVDDFEVQELVNIYLYEGAFPRWSDFHNALLDCGYSNAAIWGILKRVREGDL